MKLKRIDCPFCSGRCNEVGSVDTYDGEGEVIGTELAIIDCVFCGGKGYGYFLNSEMHSWTQQMGIGEIIKE